MPARRVQEAGSIPLSAQRVQMLPALPEQETGQIPLQEQRVQAQEPVLLPERQEQEAELIPLPAEPGQGKEAFIPDKVRTGNSADRSPGYRNHVRETG